MIDDIVEGFEIRFDSQFWRMNCQMFSWLLSSGARGGSGRSDKIAGNLEVLGAGQPAWSRIKDGVGAGGYSCGDLIEVKLHGFGVAERENEGGAGSMFGAHRPNR